MEAKRYSYTLSIINNYGDEVQIFHGKLFTLDKDLTTKGTVFMMGTPALDDEDSKLNVRIVIRNLKEEAKDDDEESGVDEGDDQSFP